jgi:hypothetical protein
MPRAVDKKYTSILSDTNFSGWIGVCSYNSSEREDEYGKNKKDSIFHRVKS